MGVKTFKSVAYSRDFLLGYPVPLCGVSNSKIGFNLLLQLLKFRCILLSTLLPKLCGNICMKMCIIHCMVLVPSMVKLSSDLGSGTPLVQINTKLECGPMPNLMVALPNIGGALCSTPQSVADAHY